MKKSKSKKYDDPTAFYRKLPPVVEITDGSLQSPTEMINTTRYYKCRDYEVTVTEGGEHNPYLVTIRRKHHYPEWDYVVWIKYNVLPDALCMAMLLPSLNKYINDESSAFKWVFTMEGLRWELDPIPTCEDCLSKPLDVLKTTYIGGTFKCANCGCEYVIDFRTWNESHGNGFHGKDE
jgi:hypothetical protein